MKKKFVFQILIVILLFFSCASIADHSVIYRRVSAGNYLEARQILEGEKSELYNNTDTVLYYLDAGLLSHYAGDFSQSNKDLTEAEKLMEYYYSKSISQSVGSYFANDTIIDYAGEEYEDIYTNIFMALNYLKLGNVEDAFVEIRRFDNKQRVLATKYADQLDYAKGQLSSSYSNSREYKDANIQFNNSALARYLSMILYRSIGRLDSAEIDRKQIINAFETQPLLYPFSIPSTVNEEFQIPNDKARVNFLSFAGLGPVKYEQVQRIASADGSLYYKLALPYMQKRGTSTDSIEVTVVDSQGVEYITRLSLLESIENIAFDTFKQKQAVIFSKTLLRSITKAATGAILNAVGENREDSNSSIVFSLLSLTTKIVTEMTEVADLRISQYFPALAYVGGITLDPGIYTMQVVYYNKFGEVLYKEVFSEVEVATNEINLIETFCTK